jgi:DNA topoisomerase IB
VVSDEETLARIRSLAIPPAWTEVWICPDPLGHLQATGRDAVGRRQYLYHPAWREQRDRAKYRRMADFGRKLPRLRRRVAADLDRPTLDRPRLLATAVRLLDVGLFRIGGEEYANDNGGLGLATVHKEHVSLRAGMLLFDYPAKSGIRRRHEVTDPDAAAVVRALKRRRGGGEQLLAYRNGRRWMPVRSDEINDYIKEVLGDEFSAKDFRTWSATVLAAALLAADRGAAQTKTARKRVINQTVREVADVLGNTPAVARRAYIDPRVFDRYQSGWTIRLPDKALDGYEGAGWRTRRRIELAVLDLIREDGGSGVRQNRRLADSS